MIKLLFILSFLTCTFCNAQVKINGSGTKVKINGASGRHVNINAEPSGGGGGSYARDNLVWISDFEDQASYDQWDHEVENGTASLSTDEARYGDQSCKFFLDPDDVDPGDRGRIEIKPPHGSVHPIELWYGISVFLPLGYENDPDAESVFQWHDAHDVCDADGTAPTMTMQIVSNEWKLTNAYDGTACTTSGSWTPQEFPLDPINDGAWTDWVLHIKWTWNTDGIIEVWQNGTKVVDYTGRTSYNDADPPYFKVGLHKWPWATEPPNVTNRIIYIDEVRIGNSSATYNDVAINQLTPEPN